MPDALTPPYSKDRLLAHPEKLAAFRKGERVPPLSLHFMPQNLCNQDCVFCSFRLPGWKNNQRFDEADSLPWDVCERTLRDASEMGVRAIEVTGGGEPLVYKFRGRMFELIRELGFNVGVVTNGTALTESFAKEFAPMLSWARVSIDAGTPETYAEVRRIPKEHWGKAWKAVRYLRQYMAHPEKRLGVGFVVTNENAGELSLFCEQAKAAGADNVRVSIRFGPGANSYYHTDVLGLAQEELAKARELVDDTFAIADFSTERGEANRSPQQTYPICYAKDLYPVVGGDGILYTCCTLAFNDRGRIGSLHEKPLKELWYSDETTALFEALDPRKVCTCQCLYEQRNLRMIELVNSGEDHPVLDMPHKDF